jgi:hypothetical protein
MFKRELAKKVTSGTSQDPSQRFIFTKNLTLKAIYKLGS